jgi:ERCC4-type nuclease|tara:strand:- start:795 stop:920 length:126 start_codon:yes stop_codon:yes gene_type:complete
MLLLALGIENSNIRTLIHYFGSIEELFSASKDELLQYSVGD